MPKYIILSKLRGEIQFVIKEEVEIQIVIKEELVNGQ